MKFEVIGSEFVKDGKPVKLISGAVHYFRNMPDTWDDIFSKMKALGLNTVETYCCWNLHEPKPGEFCFDGRLDISLFIKKPQSMSLWSLNAPVLIFVRNGNSEWAGPA